MSERSRIGGRRCQWPRESRVLVQALTEACDACPVVSHASASLVGDGRLGGWCKLPHVIDVSAVQMLLLTVTSWLDRQEREVLADIVRTNADKADTRPPCLKSISRARPCRTSRPMTGSGSRMRT